jgi:hypothetical protein
MLADDDKAIESDQMSAALVTAGWSVAPGECRSSVVLRDDANAGAHRWLAPPGTAPSGPWRTKTAFGLLCLRDAVRALAERGWLPAEHVGQTDMTTIGQYLVHPMKCARFIRISEALLLEGLPALHPCAAERL